ncbi:MAG: phosphate acyltransferase PlsX [Planctomycetota bacterium]|nr:MAG: phosphate acyltransferase PlsX [Planctomycetota bacterium]
MRLAIDAMGGDDAPDAIIEGVVDYARAHPEVSVLAVGQSDAIYHSLGKLGATPANVVIHEAPEVIAMGDKITALRDKPNDSMNTCARLLKEGGADAMVLCGNTACSVAASQLHLGRINGVKRAGILTPLPHINGTTWVIDCGANSTAKPEYLVQWAEMGAAFVTCYSGITAPRVGVLSIGTEEGKGDDLTAQSLELLKQHANLNLIGLVEGNHVFNDTVDVVVCDGFTGNVLLKSAEGTASAIGQIIKDGIHKSLRAKLGAWLMRPAFDHLKQRTHWSNVGGALLVGVNGITVIGHGRSNRVAVAHALRQAQRCVQGNLIQTMRELLAQPSQVGSQRRSSFLDSVKSFFTGSGENESRGGEQNRDNTQPSAPDNHDYRNISNKKTQRLDPLDKTPDHQRPTRHDD